MTKSHRWTAADIAKLPARMRGQTGAVALLPTFDPAKKLAIWSEPAAAHDPTLEPPQTYEFQLTPVPKPRQSQRDQWAERDCVVRYRAFADELRRQAAEVSFVLPDSGWSVCFHLPMPESWSARKRVAMFGKPHQSKPDVSNLLKSLEDVLRDPKRGKGADDCAIWEITGLRKYWADVGRIVVRVE